MYPSVSDSIIRVHAERVKGWDKYRMVPVQIVLPMQTSGTLYQLYKMPADSFLLLHDRQISTATNGPIPTILQLQIQSGTNSYAASCSTFEYSHIFAAGSTLWRLSERIDLVCETDVKIWQYYTAASMTLIPYAFVHATLVQRIP